MADDSRRVSGSVTTTSDDSKYRVMFELATRIATTDDERNKPKNRDYWLELMCDCHDVVAYGSRRKP